VRQLPLCPRFRELVKALSGDLKVRDAAMQGKQGGSGDELRRALLVALKLRDWQMLHSLGPYVKSKKSLAAMRQLVMFRLSSAPRWAATSRKLAKRELAPKGRSMNEYNALTVMRALADGLDVLLK